MLVIDYELFQKISGIRGNRYTCIDGGIFQGDIRDLSQFKNEEFDMVVCYGAPLSYVLANRDKAILEFNRVLRKDCMLFVSVNNKWV